MKTTTRKIAVYKSADTGIEVIGDFESLECFTRISEYEHVLFKMLPENVQIKNEVALIDDKIISITESNLRQIEALNARKQELLAIPEKV